jgi:hypothetical protein
MFRLDQKIHPGSALIVFPAKARRRPGSTSAMGAGLPPVWQDGGHLAIM